VKISDAIVRQREGTAQVKASADEIVNVVNESLEGRAETTSSAEALLTLSQELREAVSSFRVGAASSPSDEPRS
jgi:methyl-accepting chemotaxis protein